MRTSIKTATLSLPLMLAFSGIAQQSVPSCANCAIWNAPQAPFKIYGDTYYVGPHGLSSILITSAAGHVLIDGALPESAPLIAAHIATLGFRIEDVKLIVNSHAHFDHAGGIAELQRLSGARVAASRWSAAVMMKGAVARDDPQYGTIRPIPRIAHVATFRDGESLTVSKLVVMAHLTPGHTPGGTSWSWRSCEGSRCLDIVYADSLSAVSRNGFKFSNRRAEFEKSFAFLDSVPCDILLTPHPELSGLWNRMERWKKGETPDPVIDPSACHHFVEGARDQLRLRLVAEQTH